MYFFRSKSSSSARDNTKTSGNDSSYDQSSDYSDAIPDDANSNNIYLTQQPSILSIPAYQDVNQQHQQQFRHHQQHNARNRYTPHIQKFNNSIGNQSYSNNKHGDYSSTSGRVLSSPSSNVTGRSLNKWIIDTINGSSLNYHRFMEELSEYTKVMDYVNLASLLFHMAKKRYTLSLQVILRIAIRFRSIKEELGAREASNSLYGLKCMSSEYEEVRQLISALADKLASSTSVFTAQAIGNSLYGCQLMTSDHVEVRRLLKVLSIKINQSNEIVESQNVGNALYGIRGMISEYSEVCAVLKALVPKIAASKGQFNGQVIGNSLYGMQGMRSSEQVVLDVISALAKKIADSTCSLKSQEIGNAFYGLKRLGCNSVEVKELLSSLATKISSDSVLDSQAISNTFYGLQSMIVSHEATASTHAELLSLLSIFADKVYSSTVEIDGQSMGNSLYGLQNMSDKFPEIRACVNALSLKIVSSNFYSSAQENSNALYGLKCMTTQYSEVRHILYILSNKIDESTDTYLSREVGNSLYGIQRCQICPEVRKLLLSMAKKINNSSATIEPLGIANCFIGIRNLSSRHPEVLALLNALQCKLDSSWHIFSDKNLEACIGSLKHLCSSYKEVQGILCAFTNRLITCQVKFQMKNLCMIMHGLQNTYCRHAFVCPLIAAITKKMQSIPSTMSISDLSHALYGMQGCTGSSSEVTALLTQMSSAVVLCPYELACISNCFFGLQRLSMSSSAAVDLVTFLCELFFTSIEYYPSHLFSAHVCCNILYGLQHFYQLPPVVTLLELVVAKSTDILQSYMHSDSGSCHETDSASSSSSTNHTGSANSDANSISFSDIISLFQVYAAVSTSFIDSCEDEQLSIRYRSVYASLLDIAEGKQKASYQSRHITDFHRHVANAYAEVVSSNKDVRVSTGSLVYGFESSIIISVFDNDNCSAPTRVINVEVVDDVEYRTPSLELFMRLREKYLHGAHGVEIYYVSENRIKATHSLDDFLHINEELLGALSSLSATVLKPYMSDTYASVDASVADVDAHGHSFFSHFPTTASGNLHDWQMKRWYHSVHETYDEVSLLNSNRDTVLTSPLMMFGWIDTNANIVVKHMCSSNIISSYNVITSSSNTIISNVTTNSSSSSSSSSRSYSKSSDKVFLNIPSGGQKYRQSPFASSGASDQRSLSSYAVTDVDSLPSYADDRY